MSDNSKSKETAKAIKTLARNVKMPHHQLSNVILAANKSGTSFKDIIDAAKNRD